MTFRIIDLSSSETIKARGFPAYVQIGTKEFVELDANEVGFILGKHSFHEKGIGIFGGIVNPLWRGNLTIEFNVFGEIDVMKGQKIAHVVIVK